MTRDLSKVSNKACIVLNILTHDDGGAYCIKVMNRIITNYINANLTG